MYLIQLKTLYLSLRKGRGGGVRKGRGGGGGEGEVSRGG